MALAIVVGVALLAMPTPHGLAPMGQRVLAITIFTVIIWIFQVMNQGAASVLMLTLMVAAGLKMGAAFNAFSGPSWWVLLAVLYYGFAMEKTGLAKRLAYYILSIFPATYTGIMCAFFVIGFVLCFGIPSNTVRTAIMIPMAWSLVKSIGLPPRSRGSALIMLT
ncbi:MAG: SLC13 family permease, partial [Thermoguttaceae bacterium]